MQHNTLKKKIVKQQRISILFEFSAQKFAYLDWNSNPMSIAKKKMVFIYLLLFFISVECNVCLLSHLSLFFFSLVCYSIISWYMLLYVLYRECYEIFIQTFKNTLIGKPCHNPSEQFSIQTRTTQHKIELKKKQQHYHHRKAKKLIFLAGKIRKCKNIQ